MTAIRSARATAASACLTLLVSMLGAAAANAQCDPVESRKLLAPDAGIGDDLGRSVAARGQTVVAGAWLHDDPWDNCGAAYVFEGPLWEATKLTASDAAPGDWFGRVVAMRDDTIVVAAPYDDDRADRAGAVYVFERVGGTWTEVAKLTASDGEANDRIGQALALDGNVIVVGAPDEHHRQGDSYGYGAAYVFERVGDTWSETAKLVLERQLSERFGASVAVSGDTILVGAPWYATSGGAVAVFERPGGFWEQTALLTASDASPNSSFGQAVAMDAGIAVIGSPGNDDAASNAGAVYVLERVGGAWTEVAKLTASDAKDGDQLGYFVSCSGQTALAAAVGDDGLGDGSGSAYVFQRVAGTWSEAAKLTATDGAAFDEFGCAVSVSGGLAVVGAHWEDDGAPNGGAAYLFDLRCACPPDLNDDGEIDTRDFLLFLNAWAHADPLADWDGDGHIDSRDFLAYLGDWNIGC